MTPQTGGTLYVHLVADANPGSIQVMVKKHSEEILGAATLERGDVYDKQFPGIPLGPQEWYQVELSWVGDNTSWHNLSSDGINIIATGYPATSNNIARTWQVAGYGAYGIIPVLMNLPQAGS